MGTNCDGFLRLYRNAIKQRITETNWLETIRDDKLLDGVQNSLMILPESSLDYFGRGSVGNRWLEAKISSSQAWYTALGNGDIEELSKVASKILMNRIEVVPEPTKGESILNYLLENSPSELDHQCHGIQNIKGPGLQILEIFESFEFFLKQINALESQNPEISNSSNILIQHQLARHNAIPLAEITPQTECVKDTANSFHKAVDIPWTILRRAIRELWRPIKEARNIRKADKFYAQLYQGKMQIAEARSRLREL